MSAILAAEFGHLINVPLIPRHIHQVWLGSKPIPPEYERYADGMLDKCSNGGHWNYSLWDDGRLWELGLTPEDLKYGTPAANSNLVRLLAVFLFGGIYMDTDCEVIGDLTPLLYYNAWAAQQADGLICNACFGARQGNPWLLWQIMNYQECTKDDAGCGPRTMTRAPREFLTLIDPRICYPFSWDTPEAERKASPHSLIIHHWAKSWLTPQ